MTPLHPSIVHFPIVLFISAGMLYLLGMLLKRQHLEKTAFFFHAAGLLMAVAAIFTGDYEADRITQSAEMHEVVEKHESMVMLATYGFGMLGIWAFLRQRSRIKFEKIGFLVLYFALMGLIGLGAHEGGELVFEHGAGVVPMQDQQPAHPYIEGIDKLRDDD